MRTPPLSLAPLPRTFYERPTVDVARALPGKILVRMATPDAAQSLARIVEVEAYLGLDDAASHARRGPTPRAAIMFGPPGLLYVYLIYGMHHCMNVVTETDGTAGAVLLRAAEPLEGFDDPDAGRGLRPLSGPGKLCAGLGITLAHKGLDLCTESGGLFIADDGTSPPRLKRSARVGVDYAGSAAARKLRFYIPGNRHVSGKPRD